MKISGAIFDMDGTLTDSMFVWKDVGKRYLISCGITPREDLWDCIKDLSIPQVSEYFASEYSLTKNAVEIRDGIYSLIEPMYREEVFPKNGVVDFLREFHERGIKMCVATATDKDIVEMILHKNNMLDYFSEVFTCTTVNAAKDTPVIYEKALEHLGTPKEETLVFEDALYALRTAKNAGFIVVGVYDSFASKESDEIKALSDFYITDFSKANKLF